MQSSLQCSQNISNIQSEPFCTRSTTDDTAQRSLPIAFESVQAGGGPGGWLIPQAPKVIRRDDGIRFYPFKSEK